VVVVGWSIGIALSLPIWRVVGWIVGIVDVFHGVVHRRVPVVVDRSRMIVVVNPTPRVQLGPLTLSNTTSQGYHRSFLVVL